MATIVIDVPGLGRTLFSPVLAHSLERGDLIHGARETFRLLAPPKPVSANGTSWLHLDAVDNHGEWTWLRVWPNEPVLRAVGARAGGVL